MKKEHRRIQNQIKKKYLAKYEVEIEPPINISKHTQYRPDVLIRTKSGEIKYVIEVEGDPTRKSIVGACILANECLKTLNSTVRMYFVIYLPEGKRQIPKFRDRVRIAKKYCGNLNTIEVLSIEDFKNKTL